MNYLTLPLAALVLLTAPNTSFAADPAWWAARGVTTPAPSSNFSPATIGQAKHMVKSALDALRPMLPDVTAEIESDLSTIVDLTVPDEKTPDWIENQKAVLLNGQLKALSAPFYARLDFVNPGWLTAQRTSNTTNCPNSIFPWTTQTTYDQNKAIVMVGQLKAVFCLKFDSLTNSHIDKDGDGLPDDWEVANGLDPYDDGSSKYNNGPSGDSDCDGVSNSDEYAGESDPNNYHDFSVRVLQISNRVSGHSNITAYPMPPALFPFHGSYSSRNWDDAVIEYHYINDAAVTPVYLEHILAGMAFPMEAPTPSANYPGLVQEVNLKLASLFSSSNVKQPANYGMESTLHSCRLWIKAPALATERKLEFIKLRQKHIYTYASKINSTEFVSAEAIEVVIPANQTLSPPVDLKYFPTAFAGADVTSYESLVPVEVAVDADRDGEITFDQKDKTTAEKPFRFWINNDQDDVEADEPVTVTTADSANTSISTKRDLEDLTRIRLSVGLPLDQLKDGRWKAGLRFKNTGGQAPAIRIWPNESGTGSDDYVNNGIAAGRQIAKQTFGETNGGTVFIPQSYWQERSDTEAHLIFEGISKGRGELALILKNSSQGSEIESATIHLKLLDVREMFQRARISNPAANILHPWVDDTPPAQTVVDDPWYWPYDEDPEAEEITAIFVHGWRLTYDTYHNWAQTSYKRLWHQGFKGKFYTFRWATFSGDDNALPPNVDRFFEEETKFPPGGLTYNASEYRAWLCGPALASWVNSLPHPSTKKNIFAHSMGNVICGAALRAGMAVENYALCNAAMASMAYDPSAGLKIDPSTGESWEKIWGNFGPQQSPDTDSLVTIRTNYGLENKFNDGSNLPRMVNFYLREDAAMKSWVNNNMLFKPDDTGNNYYYQHTPVAPNISYKLFQTAPNVREVTSPPEAFGYVTKALTRPLGADPRTGGSIESAVNMDDWGIGANHWGFAETHSAQWRWSNQSTNLFWEKLCEELQLIEE